MNLYWLTALPSASRKSVVVSEGIAPLLAFERREVERMRPEVERARDKAKLLAKQHDELMRLIAKAEKERVKEVKEVEEVEQDPPTLEDRLEEIRRERSELQVPAIPRLLAQDVTAEKVGTILAEQNGRLAIISAEAALTCLPLEHFVRVVVGSEAPEGATLRNLLELAVSRNLLKLPWDDQQDGIDKVCRVRNSLLHANYAQAAHQAGCKSVEEYFKTQFAAEVETTCKVTDSIMRQIDPATGKPREQGRV